MRFTASLVTTDLYSSSDKHLAIRGEVYNITSTKPSINGEGGFGSFRILEIFFCDIGS